MRAAQTGKAADDGSRGTAMVWGFSSGWPVRVMTRPSAVSRSKRPIVVRTANSNSRDGAVDEGPHLGIPLRQAQLAGVHAVGRDGDERLRGPPLVLPERLHRRLLAGGVAVEGEDHLAAELVLVHEEPPKHPSVVLPESGAARRDRGGDPGQVAGHDVGVALDDDGAGLPGDLSLGQVHPVEDRALAVERGLGRVEVLGVDAVVVVQPAGPEPHHRTHEVADRPDEPPAEAVVGRALALGHETPRDQVLVAEAAGEQVPPQSVPVARGVADPEALRGLPVEAPLGQEPASGDRVRASELLSVVVGGDPVGVEHAAALLTAGTGPGAGRRVVVGEGQPDLLGQPFDGLGEREVLHPLEEGDDVSALAAAEAVPEPPGRGDVEEGVRSSWKGHRPFSDLPRVAQRDVLADHLVDPGTLAQLGDGAAGHEQGCSLGKRDAGGLGHEWDRS